MALMLYYALRIETVRLQTLPSIFLYFWRQKKKVLAPKSREGKKAISAPFSSYFEIRCVVAFGITG
jgi:hypothetical protein